MKNGWDKRTIDDICVFRGGGTPSKSNDSYWKGDIPWVSPKDMKSDVITDSIDHISAEAIEQSTTNLIAAGSVLVVVRSGILARTIPVAITGRDVTINQDIKALCPDKSVDGWFLFYFLKSRLEEMLSLASRGATVHRIMADQIRTMEILVPPLAEQRRIVGILDEAFEGIATAKANAEKNLQNARAMFDTFLNAVYLGRGADAWPKRRLGDVFEIGSSKRIHERDWSPVGVPFYGGKEIVKLAKFGHAVSNSYISEQKYHEYASKYDMPKPGDILITARGTIGVGYVVQKSDKFYYKDGNIISMRAKEAADPHYLLYAFRSNSLADQLGDLSGATVTHLPLEKAKELLLRMPDVDMQNAMVKRIMEFEGETQRLESIYQRKLAALDDLKKSLLHQAFSGEL